MRYNTLAYASYAILRDNVSELRAGRVLSSEEDAARVAALRGGGGSKGKGGGRQAKKDTGGAGYASE